MEHGHKWEVLRTVWLDSNRDELETVNMRNDMKTINYVYTTTESK
jgi:hypothetical protein